MRKWGLLVVFILIWPMIGLLGCQRHQPANQQVTESDSSWYLYQVNHHNASNISRLKFYTDKTVSVQNIRFFSSKTGSNMLNSDFANPSFKLNADGKEIIINTAHPKMIIALKKSYQHQINGYTLRGYRVIYQGSNYQLGQVVRVNRAAVKKFQKQQTKHVAQQQNVSDRLGKKLMTHLQPVPAKAKATAQLGSQKISGGYNYQTIIHRSRAYGHLDINDQGHFTNTLYIRAPQDNPLSKTDNPVIWQQQTVSGYLRALYGKLYLQPLNQLIIKYYTAGQNPQNPVVKSLHLVTNSPKYGTNIKVARTRIERQSDKLLLFNEDLQVWNKNSSHGLALVPTSQKLAALNDQYQVLYQHYLTLKKNPIASNADLRQFVGAIAANNDSTIAGIGVNMNGNYSIDQKVADFQGVDKKGNKQPLMQYLVFIEPAVMQEKKSGWSVSTKAGNFLIFGVLQQKLYLLEQPDTDSLTTTWVPFRNFPLRLPTANITWN